VLFLFVSFASFVSFVLSFFFNLSFLYHTVQDLGYAKAPAIWAGVGMTCAYLWGTLVFAEPVQNPGAVT
jgi:multidrug transporter EmrE-like cation transporter